MHSFRKYFINFWLLAVTALAANAQNQPATRFEVTLASTGQAISTVADLKAGNNLDIRLRVLDQNGAVVTNYNRGVTLTIRGEYGQEFPTTIPAASIVAGVADPVTIPLAYSVTKREETDLNGLTYETGVRISATDGNVITDNASGYFSVAPASFQLTYSGGNSRLQNGQLTEDRIYLARVTALNADFTIATGYRGALQIGTGIIPSTVSVVNPGSGYDPFSPPLVSIVDPLGVGTGATAIAVVDLNGTITSIVLDNSLATGYTIAPQVVIDAPIDPAGTQATAITLLGVENQNLPGFPVEIVFGGSVDQVPLLMPTASVANELSVTDGITFTTNASGSFDTVVAGGGAPLTVASLSVRNGGSATGQATTLVYSITNGTSPAVIVPGPIDTHFRLLNSQNSVLLEWTDQSTPDDVAASQTINNLTTSFVIPFNLPSGTYTIQASPGYNTARAATVSFTLANPPDLAITQFNYAPGQYSGGEALRFDLTFQNNRFVAPSTAVTAGASAVPFNQVYMVEIHLSTNHIYGDEDDFLVWQESFVGNNQGFVLQPQQQIDLRRQFKLPENLAGTYYVLARVNSSGGRNGTGFTPENIPGVITDGNNTWLASESQKITILPKQATDTFRVSITTSGAQASGLSDNAAITRDGQYVVFESLGQLDGVTQANITNIYLRNVVGNSTTLVSVGTNGAANNHSQNPEISADGRYVVFQSSATNLVAGDTNGLADIFVRDTQLGITRRLSVNPISGIQANGGSQLPSISADGRYVVFESSATNLSAVSGATGINQVYIYDRDANNDGIYDQSGPGACTLAVISQSGGVAGSFASTQPRISANGRYVVFVTRDSLFLGQSTPFTQLVRWSAANGQFLPVTSSLSSAGNLGDNDSAYPAINEDGSYIAFASRAQNLEAVPGIYSQGIPHVFRAYIDPAGSTLTSVQRMNSASGVTSEPDNPLTTLDLGGFEPSISDDGKLVAFASESQDLLPPITVRNIDRTTFASRYVYNYTDLNLAADVYLYDLANPASPQVSRASVSRFGYEATKFATTAGLDNLQIPVSRRPVVSGDGRYVAFTSDAHGHSGLIFGATNYDYQSTNGVRNVYVYDRKAALPNYQNLPIAQLLPLGISEISAGGVINLVANASSPVRSVASVEFYANNVLVGTVNAPSGGTGTSYSLAWVAPSAGSGNTQTRTYQINVMAVDSGGLRSLLSNTETLIVRPVTGVAPSVVLTNPSLPATTGGAAPVSISVPRASAINLVATVSPGSSAVTSVTFYAVSTTQGTQSLGLGVQQPGTNTYAIGYVNVLPVGSHDLIAVVKDAANNVVVSASRNLNVTAAVSGSAPTGSLVFPAAGSVLTLGQAVPMQALATDADGAIASVAFYANGTLVLADTVTPFTASWTPTVAGAYNLVLVITDAQGVSTVTAPVTVTVNQSAAPSVSFVSPASGSVTLGSTLTLAARANDTDGTISDVGFFVDGTLVALGFRSANDASLYTATWTPPAVSVRPYALVARALDNSGLISETSPLNITVVNSVGLAPSVSVTSPNFGTQLPDGSTTRLSATVVDADRNFGGVDFYVDGVLVGSSNTALSTPQPAGQFVANLNERAFSINWTVSGVGSHVVFAVARDTAGNRVASQPVSFAVASVVQTGVPSVTLTTPAGNVAIKLGEPLRLVAAANDSVGTIARVDFYANDNLIGSDTTAPYDSEFAVDSAAATGVYQIYAIAVDSDGNEALSNSILATVTSDIAPVVGAGTNDLFVYQVLLDGEKQHLELNPGDPIKYTVAYGRTIGGTSQHGRQRWRTSVYLSTDGDPENRDNFLLDFFDGVYPQGETIGRFEHQVLTDRLPPNFTGTFFLIAKIRVTDGATDGNGSNDQPSVFVTGTSRVTIRPVDMPVASRVSVDSNGGNANEISESGSVSADGRYVVFQSEATNVVASPAVPAGVSQVYLRDTVTNQTILVSQLAGVAGNAESKYPVISSTGVLSGGVRRYVVAYQSAASNLIAGVGNQDTNAKTDIFVYDLSTGVTSRASVPSGAAPGAQANNGSFLPSISADGRYLAFESDATNLLPSTAAIKDTNGQRDVYLYDRDSKSVTAVSTTAAGVFGGGASTQAQISADGSTIVFRSFARNLAGTAVPSSYTRSIVYAKSRISGAVTPVSILREVVGAGVVAYTPIDEDSFDPAVSSDGRSVAFASRGSNIPPFVGSLIRNTAKISQVYVINRQVDTSLGMDAAGNVSITLVSAGVDPVTGLTDFAEDESLAPVISGNGRFIGYRTEASNLLPRTVTRSDGVIFNTDRIRFYDDVNNTSDVYLRDTGIVSYVINSAGSGYPNGEGVPFMVTTGGGVGASALAIVENGQITRVDVLDQGAGYTSAPNSITIPGGAVNAVVTPVYRTFSERVSVSHFGQQTIGIIGSTTVPSSRDLAMSQDGRYLVFTSDAHNSSGFVFGKSNQSPLDSNSKRDVFIVDRRTSSEANTVLGQSPVVTALVPVTSVRAGAQIAIFTSATDGADITIGSGGPIEGPGVITNLKVYANNQLVVDSALAKASVAWTAPMSTGVVSVYAVATDANGNVSFSTPVSVTVTTASFASVPTVALSAPVPASVLTGQSATFSASVASASGATISSVSFYADGVLVGTDASAPYTLNYSNSTPGVYSVFAVVTDSTGNTAVSSSVSMSVTAPVAPTVSLSSTGSSLTLGGSLTLTANAADSDGTVTRVVFSEYFGSVSGAPSRTGEDRIAPYAYVFTPTQAGSYFIVAEATDSQGLVSSSSAYQIAVTASPALPTVSFLAPSAGTTAVVGQVTTLEVAVTVPTGANVNTVNFYANGQLLGSGSVQGTLARYRLNWSPSVTGAISLTAEIVDSFGGRGETASARVVNVINQVGAIPFVEIIQPQLPVTTGSGGAQAASFTTTTNSDVFLAASAVDSDDSVSSVEFFVNRGRTATATATITFPSVIVNGAALQQDTGFVGSIAIVSGGSDYLSPPSIIIVGDGTGATAEVAEMTGGSVTRIRITNRGSGYTNAEVRFVGGGLAQGISLGQATRNFSSDVWTLPAPFNFRTYGAASYSFYALAKDSNNNASYSAETNVTVTSAPLTTPVTGVVASTPATTALLPVAAGRAVQLSLAPSVVGGSVASVEFFANGESVGVDTIAPYVVNWVPAYVGNYSVVAQVTDSAGNRGVSSALAVYVGGNIAPTVALVRPGVAGATGVVNQEVLLEAEANALTSGATVSSVEFIADGDSIGIAQQVGVSNRYVLSTWRPALAKSYAITARVTDSFGQAALATVRNLVVTPQVGVVPTVIVTSPSASSTGSGTGTGGATGGVTVSNNSALYLSAQANDADGTVSSVEFLLTRGAQATATASRQLGGTGVGSITVTSPGSGYLFAPRVKIIGNGVGAIAEATVAGGQVTDIRLISSGSGYTSIPQVVIEGGGLYENTSIGFAAQTSGTRSWTYSLDLRNYDVGPYFIRARVTDNNGNASISDPVAVTVTSATTGAPTLTLAQPVPTSVVLGRSVTLSAFPIAAPGAGIVSVSFYSNGYLIGQTTGATTTGTGGTQPTTPTAPTVTGSSYSFVYTPPSAGSYTITAMVTDSAGNTALSSGSVVVTAVENAAPQVTSFVMGTAATRFIGENVTLSATATDDQGVASVSLYVNNTLLETRTAAPYAFQHTPTTEGNYIYTVTATDQLGKTGTYATAQVVTVIRSTLANVNTGSGNALNSVDDYYQDLLGRSPTRGELAVVESTVTSGISTDDFNYAMAKLAADLVRSEEFTKRGGASVILSYASVLGRYPTPSEYAAGITSIQASGDVLFIAQLLASGEYAQKFGNTQLAVTVSPNQYTAVRALAVRLYQGAYGVAPRANVANAAAQSLMVSINGLGGVTTTPNVPTAPGTGGTAAVTTSLSDLILANTISTYLTSQRATKDAVLIDNRIRIVALYLADDKVPAFADVTARQRSNIEVVADNIYNDAPLVESRPVFRVNPASISFVAGGTSTLSVEVAASPRATLQWFKDRVAVQGATGKTLQVTTAGNYYVVATNAKGRVTSRIAKVTVTPLPPSVPSSVVVAQRGTVIASIETQPVGGAGLSYFARGLPTGLTIDRASGRISGIVSERVRIGDYSVQVWTQSGSQRSATRTFIVRVQ